MSNYQNIILNVSDRIATITINRPEKLNALNHQTLSELKNCIDYIELNDQIHAVIITGNGQKAFVAGADIGEIAQLNTEEGIKAAQFGQEIFFMIENASKPFVAAVNGYALGGGCELSLACHFRVASDNAVFGQPEINLGIIPGYGGTQRLPQLIGKGKALELLLTADTIKADEALQLGLVNYVVPQTQLLEKCHEILTKIVNRPRLAAQKIIAAVNHHYHKSHDGYVTEAILFGNSTQTADFKEGTHAFLEKRKAVFTGK